MGLCPCLTYSSLVLNLILLVLAQGWRRRFPGWQKPLSQCRRRSRLRSRSTTRCRPLLVPFVRLWLLRGLSQVAPSGAAWLR